MKTWRFIDTGASDCYSNMAIDEALFQAYDPANSVPIFRIYKWQPAAFSIGLSQDPAIELDLQECGRAGIDFVRRMTGGGIILHDKELTYSIICSEKDMEKTYFTKEAYRFLCAFLINAYSSMGLDAEFSLKYDKAPKAGWICFGQKEKYDIIIGGKKIGGNAQRRKRNLIFQHGSIPLRLNYKKYQRFLKNKVALEQNDACSLSQVIKKNIGHNELTQNILAAFRQSFNADLIHDSLNSAEQNLSEHLRQSKYVTKEWNLFKNVDKAKTSVA